MTTAFARGSAPDRARDASQRTGRFKPGHKKLGGRKRGTPNVISCDYKKALLEAAYRIGSDGNGKDGIVGYFIWIAEYHPKIFFTEFLVRMVLIQNAESDALHEPPPLADESDRNIRDYIGFTATHPTKRQSVKERSDDTWDWKRQGFPIGPLVHAASDEWAWFDWITC